METDGRQLEDGVDIIDITMEGQEVFVNEKGEITTKDTGRSIGIVTNAHMLMPNSDMVEVDLTVREVGSGRERDFRVVYSSKFTKSEASKSEPEIAEERKINFKEIADAYRKSWNTD